MSKKYKTIKTLTIIAIIITIIWGVVNFVVPFLLFKKSSVDIGSANSIGIIGGSDGPTSIFIAR